MTASSALGPPWAVDPKPAKMVGAGVLGAATLTGAALLARGALSLREPGRRSALTSRVPQRAFRPTRGLHASAALLSASVLADSLIEHYRGSFENPGMYTPLIVSTLNVISGLDGATGRRLPGRLRMSLYGLGGAVGGAGLGFHVYNLLRRPGGFNWLNLFYAAPLGAPAALSLAGAIGAAGEHLEGELGPRRTLLGFSAGRFLSALTSVGLLGTVGEAGLLHFRGSFQNPFMVLPITVPPVAAGLMAVAAVAPKTYPPRGFTRFWLWLTAALGIGGMGFHAFGVSRAMGGWRNWSQNLVDGPPLPAPPSFSALAIAALSALALRGADA